ncbi:MAG: SpoIIE family protein phosphatase [Christensenellaceae bacterium]
MLKNLSIKKDRYSVLTYTLCLFGMFFLSFAGKSGEPYALPLYCACLLLGLDPVILSAGFILSSVPSLSLRTILLALGQGIFLCIVALAYRRARRKPGWEAFLYPLAALAFYIVFGASPDYAAIPLSPVLLRAVISVIVLGLSALFPYALKAAVTKSFRCRLAPEELASLSVCLVLVGIGFFRAVGSLPSRAILLFLLLVLVRCLKDPTVFALGLLFALPEVIVTRSGDAAICLIACTACAYLFGKAGKLTEALGAFAAYAAVAALSGLYEAGWSAVVVGLVAGAVPCLLFLLTPDFLLDHLEKKLVFYREHRLTRIAINRNRAVTGEQLFEISGIFREIETAFDCINQSGGEEKARLFIRSDLISSVCGKCPDRVLCHLPERQLASLDRLTAVGCAKGKVNVIDLPLEVSTECSNPSGLLATLNRHIVDYKNYMIETENQNAGRQLLAEQAKGVSEILRSMAMEQSEPFEIYTDQERKISLALAGSGILCSEILVYGSSEDRTVSLITYGLPDGKTIGELIGSALGTPFLASERIPLGEDRYCCIFRRKPRFDAAFGVSSATKDGETACGDTYSVLKINEKSFLVALSDGMGSGEYARKLSDSTISLIEGFYRTGMPPETILETVNRLLSFNREEGFVCLDIAAVNLESGNAEIIKIGSPMGFIINREKIRLLSGETLPLGLLDNMHPMTANTALAADDILVFLSDGVTAAFGSDTDLVGFLQTLNPLNPQSLTDNILFEARRRAGGASDDMTALAVRLYEAA